MSDRIVLRRMVFQGTHGVLEQEQDEPQPFEIDVMLSLDLQAAGMDDDLERTIDYGQVFETCRAIVESTRFRLVEALAEAIAQEVLAGFPRVEEIEVLVRKPRAPIEGMFDWVGVQITRRRAPGDLPASNA